MIDSLFDQVCMTRVLVVEQTLSSGSVHSTILVKYQPLLAFWAILCYVRQVATNVPELSCTCILCTYAHSHFCSFHATWKWWSITPHTISGLYLTHFYSTIIKIASTIPSLLTIWAWMIKWSQVSMASIPQLTKRMFSIAGVSKLTKASVMNPHPTSDMLVMCGQSSITASKENMRNYILMFLFSTIYIFVGSISPKAIDYFQNISTIEGVTCAREQRS